MDWEVRIKFSDRPKNRSGSNQVWDLAEKSLIDAVESAGYQYELNPGEGAFMVLNLNLYWWCNWKRLAMWYASSWFCSAWRLDASYVGEDGNKYRPVMLHRAIGFFWEIYRNFNRTLFRKISCMAGSYSGALATMIQTVLNTSEVPRIKKQSKV